MILTPYPVFDLANPAACSKPATKKRAIIKSHKEKKSNSKIITGYFGF